MKKINKTKTSLLGLLIVLIGFNSFLVGCTKASDLDDKLVSINIHYLLELIANSDEAFVYIASPTCPACVEFKPIVLELLNDENLKIYYFDTDAAFLEKPGELVDLMESLNVIGTPSIIYLDNGAVQATFEGSPTLEDLTDFFDSLR